MQGLTLPLAWPDPGRTFNPLFLTVSVKPEAPIKASRHIIFALILINAPLRHFVLYFLSQFGNEKSNLIRIIGESETVHGKKPGFANVFTFDLTIIKEVSRAIQIEPLPELRFDCRR